MATAERDIEKLELTERELWLDGPRIDRCQLRRAVWVDAQSLSRMIGTG